MEKIEIERLSYSDLNEIAKKFLKKYHPSLELPIPIEEIIEAKLNIRIIPIQNLKDIFGIEGFINSGFSEITIDDTVYNRYDTRARFTIAYELGHKILHEGIYKNLSFSTIEEYIEFQDSISREDHGWIEYQAYTFSACVLVPSIKLKEEIEECLLRSREREDFSKKHLFYTSYLINLKFLKPLSTRG